jgi:hypothetical protein
LEIKPSNVWIKKDCINVVASISLAIISYAIVAILISIFYRPDISLILEKARIFLIPHLVNRCQPEPLERTLFLLGIPLTPALFAGYYLIFKRFLHDKSESAVNKIWPAVCSYTLIALPLFIFMVLSVPTVIDPRISYGQLYITFSILDKDIPLFIFVPFIIVLYFLLKANFPPENKTGKMMTVSLYMICLLLIFYMSAIYLFSVYTVDYHFDAVFYSMVQLFKGVPPGVNGFSNTYGLYPYFLNVIFKITGMSVLKCSIVFCMLIGLSYLLIFLFLKNTVNNKLLMFLGFTSVIFFPQLSFYMSRSKMLFEVIGKFISHALYQYLPIRYIFPCLLLYLGALYIKNKNKYLYITASIVCGLALLWNFDTGLITALSWILLNIYSDCEQDHLKTILKNSLWHLIIILSIIIITVLCFMLVVFICYGRILNPVLCTQTILIFSQLGYFMLPMPLIHPWTIVVLAYIAGIGISIRAIVGNDITPWTKNIFLVTIMGTGMLLYYQGRSHDYTFLAPIFYFYILLTLFLDKLFSFLKSEKNFLLSFLSMLIASILSLAIIFMTVNIQDEYSLLRNAVKDVYDSPDKAVMQKDCDFIRRHAGPSEKIIIFARDEAIYFSQIPNVSAFNPGFSECFLKTDYARLKKLIAESDVKIFMSEVELLVLDAFSDIGSFNIADSNNHMLLLVKETDHKP